MFLVRKTGETYGLLGKILLNLLDRGRGFLKKTPSQIEIAVSLNLYAVSLLKGRDYMPRRARRESSTGIYHVMTRGLNKMPVFKEKREKTRFVNLIRENLSKYDVAIYAYCIMPNHFHLLIKADLQELASFMAKILASFAHYYNFKHCRVGYVFQDRFKSQCIEQENYFWNCFRYIHRNPSKNGRLEDLLRYEYSSMADLYYNNKSDIIAKESFEKMKKRFYTRQDFLAFHDKGSWDIFEDVEEDIEDNNFRIANELLTEYQWKYDLSDKEVLEYIKTRREYENELMKILQVSKKKVLQIEDVIRQKQRGTG